jgi:hypothetical protein
VTQPRVAAIEKSRNVTIDVLDQYVRAVGGQLEVSVRMGGRRIPLLTPPPRARDGAGSGDPTGATQAG